MATDQGVGGSNPLTHVAKESKSIAIMLLDFYVIDYRWRLKNECSHCVAANACIIFHDSNWSIFMEENWIDVKGQKALSKMVVNIFNPLLLIYSISGYDF